MHRAAIDAVIPALNEEAVVGRVVRAVRRTRVRHIIVVDNGSTDSTACVARRAGARVIHESKRGYGAACLAGIRALSPDTEVVVFLDADGSDDPESIERLLAPIERNDADLVVGVRDPVERGALTLPQRLGNMLAARWLRRRYGLHATDLGPLRAIRRSSLNMLGMSDLDYGWTVEMQIKAAQFGLRYAEVHVPYRKRVGVSKISGHWRGSLGASAKILLTLLRYDPLWAR